jgi:hypothetical protein
MKVALNRLQYIPLRDIDTVTNALNFSTQDCHIIGSCDIYTTKAAGGDKKLYRNIENSLESQHEALRRLSASLSPVSPSLRAMGDNVGSDGHSSSFPKSPPLFDDQEIDLSRASPFGNLGQVTARRTFAYLIATLNASHPDYDFSHILRPSDFRKERSLRAIMNNIDNTLQNLRPKQTAAMNYLSPPTLSNSAPAGLGTNTEIWSQNMWKLIDKEMGLRHCEKYTYVPDDDPFDGEEGAIWSMHYFFFSKEKKRVCYIYLRGFSVISHSPVTAPKFSQRSKAMQRSASSLSLGEGAGKRASFWLSDDMLSKNIDNAAHDDDDDEVMITSARGDDEVEVPFMDLEDIRSDLMYGRTNYAFDDEDGEDDFYTRSPQTVASISEEIGETMEMDY